MGNIVSVTKLALGEVSTIFTKSWPINLTRRRAENLYTRGSAGISRKLCCVGSIHCCMKSWPALKSENLVLASTDILSTGELPSDLSQSTNHSIGESTKHGILQGTASLGGIRSMASVVCTISGLIQIVMSTNVPNLKFHHSMLNIVARIVDVLN